MIKSILTAALLFATLSYGSFEAVNISPNAVRIGNISGFKKGDVIVPYMNYDPGTLAAAYLVPFGLNELSMQQVSYSNHLAQWKYLVAGSNFGNSDYRETSAMLAVSVFSEGDLNIFPSVKYYRLENQLGGRTSFGADINTAFIICEGLSSVFSILNIYTHETEEIDIPMTMLASFEYITDGDLSVYTGLEKSSSTPAAFKTGLEYAPFDHFAVSAGYNFDPQLVTAGFAIGYSKWSFSYGMSYHFDLEYSYSFGIVYGA
ncbi:MAG: hypothetical protein R6V47_07670 [Candidatus Delongbacteria bacterium]